MSKPYNTDKEDNWYKWQGQKPPEHIPHITEEEREEILRQNMESHTCRWYQQGNYVVCKSGESEHGRNIGINKMLDKEASDRTGTLVLKPFGAVLRD